MKRSYDQRVVTSRIMAALFATQSLGSAGFIMMFTVTPILAAQLSGQDSAAGVPATVLMVGRALIAFPIGWLMDRVGRRLGLSLGYLLLAGGAALGGWAVIQGSYWALLASAVLLGMARGASEQARFAAAEVQPLERRAKAIGLIVFAGTLGAVGGPLAVVPTERLADQLSLPGLTGPWLLASGLGLLAALLIYALLRPDPLTVGRALVAAGQPRKTSAASARPMRAIFAGAYVRLAVAAMVIGQLVMTLHMVITPLHMSHHDHSTQAISWVIMAHTLGMFGLSGLTGWLIDRVGRVPMILAGAFVLVSAGALAPLSFAVPILGLALFLLGLGWNFCHLAGSSLLSDALTSNERGRAQGISEMFVALASSGGSLSTGVIFARNGLIAVSMTGLVLSLVLIALVGWALAAQRQLSVGVSGD